MTHTPGALASTRRLRPFAFTLLLPLLALAAACAPPAPDEFQGTRLTAGESVPSFHLTDQRGQAVSSSDYRGRVVMLTFLYTNCPDVCPIVTAQLRRTRDALGADASEVALVAVSVDPERDTVEAAREYSDKWKMSDGWSYLIGSRDDLAEVWSAFYVDPVASEGADHGEGSAAAADGEGRASAASGSVDALRQGVRERYLVSHSAPVYLIDREGVMRVVHTPPLDADALAHDMRLLLR